MLKNHEIFLKSAVIFTNMVNHVTEEPNPCTKNELQCDDVIYRTSSFVPEP